MGSAMEARRRKRHMGAIFYFEESVSLSHSLYHGFPHPLREGGLPEVPSFLPSACALPTAAGDLQLS